MESPLVRPKTLPNLLVTPDPFTDDDGPSTYEKRHVIDILSDNGMRIPSIIANVVASELIKYGIEHDFPSNNHRSRVKSRKSPRGQHKDVINGLHRTVETTLTSGTNIRIPFIVRETCNFIRDHITDEGILRKSGSSSRVACIMQRFLCPDNEEYFSTFDTVHDVANVLKQYLRELEQPLIPHNLQNVFLKCLDLESENTRIDCMLLASCLLPVENVGVLSYIMEFLSQVAECSKDNLMTKENLAIVMGPNIMPIIDHPNRKNDKERINHHNQQQKPERHILDLHNKVVEILISNAARVGYMSSELERKLDSYTTKSSEDELENEGVGRRKKRRSGSLNRMLGFLKKVTGKSGMETPIVPSTPGADSFSHTPIINGSTRKKTNDDNLFSLQKKKTLMDGVRKHGFHSKRYNSKTPDAYSTPNSGLSCKSPAVCLDPSPMRADWKQTPNGNRLKNFVTPSLLRRRDKTHPHDSDKNIFSAPAKPSKPRLRFGKKASVTGKKDDMQPELQTRRQISSSTISIHQMAESPRLTLHRNPPSSSRIPRPSSAGTHCQSLDSLLSGGTEDAEGDYVTISSNAELNDVKNEAFIASSISLTMTDSSNKTLDTTTSTSTLQLTPLIKEIDTLTKTAGELCLSAVQVRENITPNRTKTTPLKNAVSGRSLRSQNRPSTKEVNSPTLSESARSLRSHTVFTKEEPSPSNSTSHIASGVETKFLRAVNETKIIQIQSENLRNNKPGTGTAVNQLHRRLSVQDRGLSPSQRRISSMRRRRSHEIGRVTPSTAAPRFASLRSPLAQSSSSTTSSSLKRSPTRCTLRRGRPNTTRVGLARPSPVRNVVTPRSNNFGIRGDDNTTPKSAKNSSSYSSLKKLNLDSSTSTSDGNNISPKSNSARDAKTTPTGNTPMRRMSSVQELVNKLEKQKREKKPALPPKPEVKTLSSASITETGNTTANTSVPPELPERTPIPVIRTRSKTRQDMTLKPQIQAPSPILTPTSPEEINWVSAHKFGFDHLLRKERRNSDRDSIHFLKTSHAGKVQATAEYFNKIGKHKSPGKSMIPRYTALHKDKPTTPTASPHGVIVETDCPSSTDRLSRRLSSIDIRNKHEQLLENIKKERNIVKRSNTTAGSFPSTSGNIQQYKRRIIDKPVTRNPSFHRKQPDLKSPAALSRPTSFRTTRSNRTPRILEEEQEQESLTTSVKKAIETLLGTDMGPNSPLMSSNLANVVPSAVVNKKPALSPKPLLISKTAKMSSPTPISSSRTRMGNKSGKDISITRTASEIGTKATTPRITTTPKIRKALTTRAYDMIGTPTMTPRRSSRAHANKNSENRNTTPLRASHIVISTPSYC